MTTPSLTAFRVGQRHVAVRLSVTAPSMTPPNPMHLAILLDTSGSMDGDRMTAVKRTLHAARDLFQPTDRLTLVCFDDVAKVVSSGLSMTESGKERLYERVDRITTQGCTNLSAGIEKLLTEQQDDRPYTGLVVLTDGLINRGIISTAGLRDMVSGLDAGPVTALGYGAEHNRTLLRDLAVCTRGAYTFVDSDEVLPVVMGDLVGGQRSRVLQEAAIAIDGQPNWISAELDGDGARHVVGDIVPDRDYWIVFENADAPAAHPLTVTLSAASGLTAPVTLEIPEEAVDPTGAATLQVLRCRVAAVSAAVTNALEAGRPVEDAYNVRLTNLREELDAASASDPLVLRLRAQVAELLDAIEHAPAPVSWGDNVGSLGATTPTTVLARLASNTAQISLQRGVASASIGDPGLPATMFSSPVQREASNSCRRAYHHDPQTPPMTP